ncbi:hypothetical protein AAU57_14735 [Nonlabens sp. YIK11]|nr:hypothetical protein AAU57_14735 [Nonlabens sp. YIK11]
MTFAASQGRSHVASLSLLTCSVKIGYYWNKQVFFDKKMIKKRGFSSAFFNLKPLWIIAKKIPISISEINIVRL